MTGRPMLLRSKLLAAQDQAFIRAYNAAPNRSHFRTVSRNCADFAKDVINFYYPKALHRSIVADVGITTPKQMAKRMVKFSARHPRAGILALCHSAGSGQRCAQHRGARSGGVVFQVKKIYRSQRCGESGFCGMRGGGVCGHQTRTTSIRRSRRMVFNADRDLEPPVGAEDRRSYQIELNHLVSRRALPMPRTRVRKNLARMMNNAAPGFDSEGRPVLRMRDRGRSSERGRRPEATFFATQSSGRFAQQILEARLREELRRGNPPKVSESDVERDWSLLEKARNVPDEEVASRSARQSLNGRAIALEPPRQSPVADQPQQKIHSFATAQTY